MLKPMKFQLYFTVLIKNINFRKGGKKEASQNVIFVS